jgi:hypothetical protein
MCFGGANVPKMVVESVRPTGGDVGRVFGAIGSCRRTAHGLTASAAGSNSERETKGRRGTAVMTHLVGASSPAADREGRQKAMAGASNQYDARAVSPKL